MVVAVPMLVVMRVLADHIPGLEKFGNFLAGEAPPEIAEDEADTAPDDVSAVQMAVAEARAADPEGTHIQGALASTLVGEPPPATLAPQGKS